MILKMKDLKKSLIKSKNLFPFYLFLGEDYDDVNMCVSMFKRTLYENIVDVLFSIKYSFEEIISEWHSNSLFSNKKTKVDILNINKLNSSCCKKIYFYLKNPISDCFLTMLYNGDCNKESIIKVFIQYCIESKNCAVINCKLMFSDNELIELIRDEFLRNEKIVSYEFCSMLIEQNSRNLLSIFTDIDKILIFINRKKYINENDVKDIVSNNYLYNENYSYPYKKSKLSLTIEAKDIKNALFILEELINNKENSINILLDIYFTIRKLLCAKDMLNNKGYSIYKIASIFRINHKHIIDYFNNLKKHKEKVLKIGIKLVLQADIIIKNGKADNLSVLEKIIFFICN
ncbi:MAG: hypothetical protein LBL53_01640 [Endomicrobium sp.]|jgi:DNA polymerase III delta subunit|nr:hypothetical protein [Endomicrobium sp.]